MVEGYKEILKNKMDQYVHLIYKLTRVFPKEELYGSVSQIRRAGLSVILNYIEGYARKRPAVQLNFLEISFGSLKESKYLLYFSWQENFINQNNYSVANSLAEEISAMLWTEINNLEKNIGGK